MVILISVLMNDKTEFSSQNSVGMLLHVSADLVNSEYLTGPFGFAQGPVRDIERSRNAPWREEL